MKATPRLLLANIINQLIHEKAIMIKLYCSLDCIWSRNEYY